MGYSVYVVCENEQAQQKMSTFLKSNLVSWTRLVDNARWVPKGTAGRHYTEEAQTEVTLSYCHHKPVLGFDFSVQGDASGYLWALLRFIALRVGDQKEIDGSLTKYIVYDGHEEIPLGSCDENGFALGTNKHFFNPFAIREADRLVKAEMSRLGNLWAAQQT